MRLLADLIDQKYRMYDGALAHFPIFFRFCIHLGVSLLFVSSRYKIN